MTAFQGALDGLTRVPGVRGALLVSLEDGLVVAESAMSDVDPAAVAALSASLAARLARSAATAGLAAPQSLHLEARHGGFTAAPIAGGLLLVAVTAEDANLGLLRLALREAAARIT